MKKFISMFLAASMVLSGGVAANAETDYEDVISKAREYFDIPEDITEVDISRYDENIGISWHDYDGGREYTANADKHGCITYFYSYDDTEDGTEKISADRAEEIAGKLIKAVYGENSSDIVRKSRSISPSRVNIEYSVVKNGVEADVSLNVSVNRFSGAIESFGGPCMEIFGYDYTDPAKVKLLTHDGIFKNYKDTKKLQLVYNVFYDYEKREKTVRPVYRIAAKDINAVTGEEFSYADVLYGRDMEAATEEEADDAGGAAFSKAAVTPVEKQAIEDFKNLISKETADGIIKKHFPAVKEFKLTSSSVYSDWMDKQPVISLSYDRPSDNDGKYGYASARLDAQTGDILGYSCYGYGIYDDEEAELVGETCIKQAEKLVFDIAPDIYKSGSYETRFENNRVYFERIENGIPVNSQFISVGFDKDGTINSYTKEWKDLEFPELDGIADERSVFETSLNSESFGLYYKYAKDTPVLVYSYKGSYRWSGDILYDAFTGKRIDSFNGEPYQEENGGKYTDIDGSPYKNVIETLAEYGYTLPYERFEPETPITVSDFYKFMGGEPVYIDAYYGRYGRKEGLFTQEQGNMPLTKNDMVKIFVDEAGYSKLADKDIFVNPFTDIENDKAGYAVIASALGLIPDSSGEFNGSMVITRGQAAEYIYGLLLSQDML